MEQKQANSTRSLFPRETSVFHLSTITATGTTPPTWARSSPEIQYKGGINLYEYARDNPHIWTDPHGLKEVECTPIGSPQYGEMNFGETAERWTNTSPGFCSITAVRCYVWRKVSQSFKCPKCCGGGGIITITFPQSASWVTPVNNFDGVRHDTPIGIVLDGTGIDLPVTVGATFVNTADQAVAHRKCMGEGLRTKLPPVGKLKVTVNCP